MGAGGALTEHMRINRLNAVRLKLCTLYGGARLVVRRPRQDAGHPVQRPAGRAAAKRKGLRGYPMFTLGG